MIMQITMDIEMNEYSCGESTNEAMLLLKAMIKGEADWPDKIRLDTCCGPERNEEWNPHI